jgi:hypothetical protein
MRVQAVPPVTLASEGTLSFPEHDDSTIGLNIYRKNSDPFFGARDPDTRKVHSTALPELLPPGKE